MDEKILKIMSLALEISKYNHITAKKLDSEDVKERYGPEYTVDVRFNSLSKILKVSIKYTNPNKAGFRCSDTNIVCNCNNPDVESIIAHLVDIIKTLQNIKNEIED